jgi:hypothetical protein
MWITDERDLRSTPLRWSHVLWYTYQVSWRHSEAVCGGYTHRQQGNLKGLLFIFFFQNKGITPRKTVAETAVRNFLHEVDKRPCVPPNAESCNKEPPPPRPQSYNMKKFDDQKHLVRAVGNCRVYELAIELYLRVLTICKCSINPITNPNPVYSHSYTWQYCVISFICQYLFLFSPVQY